MKNDRSVQKVPIPSFFNDKGIHSIKLHEIKPSFKAKKTFVSMIPPKIKLGNHKHSRWEAFIGIGNGLEIQWIDKKGKVHKDTMNPSKDKFFLFIVSPYIPHAIFNNSDTNSILIEFTSGKLINEVSMDVI